MRRRTWLLGGAIAAAAAILGIGAVMAQEGSSADGTSFLDRVAAKLGIDTPKLEQAIEDARTDEINEAVADGDLTQEQADRLLERLENAPGGWAPFSGGPRFHGEGEFSIEGDFFFDFGGRGRHPGFGLGIAGGGEELAAFLGIEQDQLREELAADGATLATVAEAHGKNRDELKTWILGEAKSRLDEAVADGDSTQERADEAYAHLESNIDELIDRESLKPPMEVPFGFGPGLRHGIGLIGPGEELATFLGITQEQLFEELSEDGATIASVAEAHGKSRDDLKAWMLDEAKSRLDEAVADGDITQERADEAYSRIESSVDDLIDGASFKFRFHRFPGGGGKDDGQDAEPEQGATDSRFSS